MPAARSSARRRRSSLANLAAGLSNIKPGQYGLVPARSPKSVTFAPNVTPGTFHEDPYASLPDDFDPETAQAEIFPEVEPEDLATAAHLRSSRRKRSASHIPRPPNAFMLFRANFVKQKHVPGSIETNHGSLSKIIGTCWRSLPLKEKAVWDAKAKVEKEKHKQRYPNYKFKPVHDKNKRRLKKEKALASAEEEERIDTIAAILLEGHPRDDDDFLREYRRRVGSPSPVASTPASAPAYSPAVHSELALPPPRTPIEFARQVRPQRRSSSVPPLSHYTHNPIALPVAPFFTSSLSRPGSPPVVANIARTVIGQRRPSSAQPVPSRSWMNYDQDASAYLHAQYDMIQHQGQFFQRTESPLPEADTSHFEQSFLSSSSFAIQTQPNGPFNVNGLLESLEPNAACAPPAPYDSGSAFGHTISPLDAQHHNGGAPALSITIPYSDAQHAPDFDPLAAPWSNSQPSTAYSGSPATSDSALPPSIPHAHLHPQHQHQPQAQLAIHAPVPQHAGLGHWAEYAAAPEQVAQYPAVEVPGGDMAVTDAHALAVAHGHPQLELYAAGLEGFPEHGGMFEIDDASGMLHKFAPGVFDAPAPQQQQQMYHDETTPPAAPMGMHLYAHHEVHEY